MDGEWQGEVSIQNNEKTWAFIPNEQWKSGEYQVRINTWLEDLAGNNLSRLFEIDLTKEGEIAQEYGEEIIQFTVMRHSEETDS